MSQSSFPICEALSLLKKTLNGKEFSDFWSIILILMNKDVDDKIKAVEIYKATLFNYSNSNEKEKKSTFKLMKQVARHYKVSKQLKAIIESNKASDNNDVNYKDSPYYKDICTALKNVDDAYYTFKYHDVHKLYERMFAYELYHQIRVIIDKKKKKSNNYYNNVYLNGEPDKFLNLYIKLANTENKVNKKRKYKGLLLKDKFSPDLVLHGSPNETNEQFYIAEIKMQSNDKVVSDLLKMTDYVNLLDPKFKMHFLIYILYSLDDDVLMEKLKAKIKNKEINPQKLSRDIICIEASGKNNIRTRTLGSILDQIKENK